VTNEGTVQMIVVGADAHKLGTRWRPVLAPHPSPSAPAVSGRRGCAGSTR